MRKRQSQEFANEVINYYNGVANHSKKITAKHFIATVGKTKSTVYKIIARYLERGTTTYKKPCGRISTQSTDENLNRLREILQNDPNTSLRQAAQILGIPRSTVSKMKLRISRGGTSIKDKEALEFEKEEFQNTVFGGDSVLNSSVIIPSFPNVDVAVTSDPPPKIDLVNLSPPSPPVLTSDPPMIIKDEVINTNQNDDQLEHYDDALFSPFVDNDAMSGPSTPVALEGDLQSLEVKQEASKRIQSPPPPPSSKLKKVKRFLQKKEEYSVDDNHCLFCLQAMRKDQTPVLTNDKVDANFDAMFILHKMLDLPKSKLAEYLETVGNPPEEWIVFCRRCLKLVDEAINIQKEISDLEERLRRCQAGMFQEIRTNWKEDAVKKPGRKKKSPPSSSSNILKAIKEIRKFINFREFGVTEDLEESSGPVRSRRRWRRIKGHRKSLREVSLSPVDFCDREPSPSMNSSNEDTPDTKSGPKKKSSPSKKCTAGDEPDTGALNDEGYNCSSCPNLESMNLGTLINHGLFHFRRPLKCYQCGLHFSSSSELKENPFAKKPDSIHICSSDSLVQTIFDPGNIWECSFCPEKFSSDIERDSHEKTCHSGILLKIDLPHKCISCSKQFRSLAERLLHRVLEHPEVASLSCLFCDETFSLQTFDGVQIPDISKINEHIRRSHGTFPNKRLPGECDFCGAFFWTSTNLQSHMVEAHGLNKTLTYFCSICHCRRGFRSVLTDHMIRIHMLDDPSRQFQETLSCQICGYKTVKEIMLFEHKLTKHGVDPEDGRRVYTCMKEGCDFRTVMDQSFTSHLMKEHEEEKKYICRYCGKEFDRIKYRNTHEQIHLNQHLRPYQCEMCGKSYAVKTYLYIHKRTTHQKRPFNSSSQKRRKFHLHQPRGIVGPTSVKITGGSDTALDHSGKNVRKNPPTDHTEPSSMISTHRSCSLLNSNLFYR